MCAPFVLCTRDNCSNISAGRSAWRHGNTFFSEQKWFQVRPEKKLSEVFCSKYPINKPKSQSIFDSATTLISAKSKYPRYRQNQAKTKLYHSTKLYVSLKPSNTNILQINALCAVWCSYWHLSKPLWDKDYVGNVGYIQKGLWFMVHSRKVYSEYPINKLK